MPNSTSLKIAGLESSAYIDTIAGPRPLIVRTGSHLDHLGSPQGLAGIDKLVADLGTSTENDDQLDPAAGLQSPDPNPKTIITPDELDQYYTKDDVAQHLYGVFAVHFDPADYQLVEPSAGAGAFFRMMPDGSFAYDIAPAYPGIEAEDFLAVEIPSDRPIAIVGNPPFGKNSSTAVRFFNHAARQSAVIAFILPKTFRKASIQNQLDRHFHLVYEEELPKDSFSLYGKSRHVPTVFQIWERRSEQRDLRPTQTEHPDFAFTTPGLADFVVQRVGARAGRVHHDFTASRSSHYFIKGGVEAIMRELDLAKAASNVAGNPSLAKSELIALYCERTGRRAG